MTDLVCSICHLGLCLSDVIDRARRKRTREAHEIRDHNEGMSTDDELSYSELAKFTSERGNTTVSSHVTFLQYKVSYIWNKWQFDFLICCQEACLFMYFRSSCQRLGNGL